MSESHSRRRWSRPCPPSCSGNHWGGRGVSTAPPAPPSRTPHPGTHLLQHSGLQYLPEIQLHPAGERGGGVGEAVSFGAGGQWPPQSCQPGGPAPSYLPRRSSWSGSLSNTSTSISCPGTSCTMNWGTGSVGGAGGPPTQHGQAGDVMGVPVSSLAGWGCSCPHCPSGGAWRVSVLPHDPSWSGGVMWRVWGGPRGVGGVSPRRPHPRWG